MLFLGLCIKGQKGQDDRAVKILWVLDKRVLHQKACSKYSVASDFIWIFLPPYKGVIPNPKMVFIFLILCILVIIFPKCMNNFPNCKEKGSFPKSKIKSLVAIKHILGFD